MDNVAEHTDFVKDLLRIRIRQNAKSQNYVFIENLFSGFF